MRVLISLRGHVGAIALATAFSADGWIVERVDQQSGESLADWSEVAQTVDLIVTDMMCAAKVLRGLDVETPLLQLLDHDAAPGSLASALNAGADGVLNLSADPLEVTATAGAIARRHRGHGSSFLAKGPVVIDVRGKTCTVHGKHLHLTRHEFHLLETLMTRDRVQSKENLMDALYGSSADNAPEVKIVDVFICKLRKKLREAGAAGLIQTRWGRGYAFEVAA